CRSTPTHRHSELVPIARVCVLPSALVDLSTLSLHDALPIWSSFVGPSGFHIPLINEEPQPQNVPLRPRGIGEPLDVAPRSSLELDRKSTRLNSSHLGISYAVFCLKEKRGQPRARGHD